ncbi:MAG: hypothetical protein ABEJ30_02745 [Halorientalis sp.]
MSELDREAAVARAADVVDAVASEPMPVPIREVWVYGDVALGLDPVERLDVYVTKDVLFGRESDREAEFRESHGVAGVGQTVDADWAEQFPEYLRANANGHAAPEQCLAAHLLDEDEPAHLEVCNAPFEDNVTRRLEGALAREDYSQILDPRGVYLWAEGQRSDEAFRRLRESEFAFPPLPEALEMLGLDPEEAETAAAAVEARRAAGEGRTVRGDVL